MSFVQPSKIGYGGKHMKLLEKVLTLLGMAPTAPFVLLTVTQVTKILRLIFLRLGECQFGVISPNLTRKIFYRLEEIAVGLLTRSMRSTISSSLE